MKYQFKGYGLHDSICDVKIWHNQDLDKYIVLFTDLGEGTSVTNAANQLCAEIYLQYLKDINLDNILFFEKYPYQDFYSIIKIENSKINKEFKPSQFWTYFASVNWKFYSNEDFNKLIENAKVKIN